MIKTMIQLMAVACAVFIGLTLAVDAAPQKKEDKGKAAQSVRPAPKDQRESNAFNQIGCRGALDAKGFCPPTERNDPATILTMAERFMVQFPTSALAGEVAFLRFDAFVATKKFDPAIDELQKGVDFQNKYLNDKIKAATDKNSPELQDLDAQNKSQELTKYQQLMEAASAANQMKLAAAAGDFILQRIPNHYPTLMMVARTKAQSVPKEATDKQKAAQLDEAEEAGQNAVNAVMAFLDSPQSAEYTPAQRDDLAYRAHSIMGIVYIQRERFKDAQKAYQMALTLKKDDPVSYYYLGYSYYRDTPTKSEAAIDVLLKSAAQKGSASLEQGTRALLNQIYKDTKKPAADLDKDIQTAATRLGK